MASVIAHDLAGAALTVLALALLAAGGVAAARRLLGREEAERDPLGLAVATLLLVTVEAIAVALLLGTLGALRIGPALLTQALLVGLLCGRRTSDELAAGRGLAARAWAVMKRQPLVAILVAHAAAGETLRGVLRPPLSWDALMQHLWLAANWLRQGDLMPPLGFGPHSYYSLMPADGSLWLWWWLAPSHGELYVNLAALPHWALLGLAAGGIARELGAARSWPLASALVLVTPVVARFAATQYVDLQLAASLLAATYFVLRWLREPRWGFALLLGCGLGVVAGTKVLGIGYAAALGGAALFLGGRPVLGRAGQLAVAALPVALLGGWSYARNVALGVGPLAMSCLDAASRVTRPTRFALPHPDSVLARPDRMLGDGQLLDALLGSTKPPLLEQGIGPQLLVLVPAALVLPLVLWRQERRAGVLVAVQLLAQLLLWLTVPSVGRWEVYTNTRYLQATVALAAAALVVVMERWRMPAGWRLGIVVAFMAQSLLQLRPELPFEARLALGAMDAGLVALALSAPLRARAARRLPAIAACAALALVLAAPALARFRRADRERALAREFTVHETKARLLARAWAWLDRHAGRDAVATVGSPFPYAAMGPDLARDALFVNVDRAARPLASDYPGCRARAGADREAWLDNLERHRIRWLMVTRATPAAAFPFEATWAASLPHRFARRYGDAHSLIYELLPDAAR
jgi:hypothetical protein